MDKVKKPYKAEPSYEELIRLPFKIPIEFNGLTLGKLKIDYEENRSFKPSTREGRRIGILNIIVFAELIYLSKFLKEDIELAIRFDETKRDNLKRFARLLNLFYYTPGQQLSAWLYYLINDYDIFDLIKSDGPISLRNSIFQIMMRTWLSDKNIAVRKLNKLSNSLKEFSLGNKDRLSKVGRPEIEIVKVLGSGWIRDMYYDLQAILKIAKKNRECYQANKIHKLISQAYKEYISSIEKILRKNPDLTVMKNKLKRLKQDYKWYINTKSSNPISECIENNKELMDWFVKFELSPYQLAKEIIAKLLDVSVHKIHSIVSRKA